MSALAILVRFLFVLIVLRLVFRTVVYFFRPREEAPKVKAGADLVRDPVCHTFIPQDRALRAVVGGKPEYFCSAACRDRAFLNPSLSS
jgi:YHS domain-containing protein